MPMSYKVVLEAMVDSVLERVLTRREQITD